jgi:hypothetical protein
MGGFFLIKYFLNKLHTTYLGLGGFHKTIQNVHNAD